MPAGDADSVSWLMAEFRGGSSEAAGKLVELFYPQLRRLASARMTRERLDHTWQPTVLVNELYLQLIHVRNLPPGNRTSESGSINEEEERDAFLGLAAFLMKRLLLHHARPLPKRVTKANIGEAIGVAASGQQALTELEEILSRLGTLDPKLRAVVEMKVFEGLSREEIAERLDCSVRTVARHWEFAQFWLRKTMSPDGEA